MPDDADGIALPPFPYVPGQNARHPEDWFDEIKNSVSDDLPPDELHKTTAFRAGLMYLESGYFWECHEVLEAVWMQTPQGTPERELVQALIQLANARLKILMTRPRAALRLCAMVEAHLSHCPHGQAILGMDPQEVGTWVAELRLKIAP